MDNPIVPWIPLIAAVAVAIITTWRIIVNRKADRREPLPPTWPEMWAEIQGLGVRLNLAERKQDAMTRIVSDAAAQWPSDRPGPTFRDEDLEILGDTIPVRWRRQAGRPPLSI